MSAQNLKAAPLESQRLPQRQPKALQQLLAARADLWRGQVEKSAVTDGIPSGFAALDQALPWRGWPTNGLVEILTDQPGAGFALILPALARLGANVSGSGSGSSGSSDASVNLRGGQADQPIGRHQQHSKAQIHERPLGQGWLLLVNPPLIPYAPALVAEGLDLERLILIDAPGQCAWAMEQGLRLGGCAAVIGWSTSESRSESKRRGRKQDAVWTTPVLRRLQLAAQVQSTPTLLLRPTSAAEQSSPASLRLDCEPSADGLLVLVRKLSGGRAGSHLRLSAWKGVDAMSPPIPSNDCEAAQPSARHAT